MIYTQLRLIPKKLCIPPMHSFFYTHKRTFPPTLSSPNRTAGAAALCNKMLHPATPPSLPSLTPYHPVSRPPHSCHPATMSSSADKKPPPLCPPPGGCARVGKIVKRALLVLSAQKREKQGHRPLTRRTMRRA